MNRRLPLAALYVAAGLLLAPVLPARAQPAPEATSAAADALVPYLQAPAVLAATAALLHAGAGAYPGDPFALLGAPAAAATGARQVPLASLALTTDADTLRVLYVLTPSAAHPDERTGGFALFPEGDGYTARFRVDLRDDPDLREAVLPLAEAGTLRVRSARGRLCLDLPLVRTLAADGRVPEAAPFLAGDPITVTFVSTGAGHLVATATLAPPGGPGRP
jgi:hypothetical protein